MLSDAKNLRQLLLRGFAVACVILFSRTGGAKDPTVVILHAPGPAPFAEVIKGFRGSWSGRIGEFRVSGPNDMSAAQSIIALEPTAVFAIGDAARSVASKSLPNVPIVSVFTESVPSGAPTTQLELSLDIPPKVLMERIRNSLPDVRKLGIVYDPAQSGPRIESFASAAAGFNIHLTAVAVSASSDLARVLKELLPKLDAFLVLPDATIATKGNVRYILRKALATGTPVIGYNSWFSENGAVVSVALDYVELGRSAARTIREGVGSRQNRTPDQFLTIYNLRVARKLGLRVDADFDDPRVRVLE